MKSTAILIFSLIIVTTPRIVAQSGGTLIDSCATAAGDDATYLKDFVVKLPKAAEGQQLPVARYPLVLSKSNIYRFSVCSAGKARAVLQIYDSNRMIFSSVNKETGEEFNPFNFLCQKTGIYHVFISFLDGEGGQAVGILSYVNK